jgi:hypothetical protein
MEIAISDLRNLCTKLLDHVEEQGSTSFVLDVDYYWDALAEERYDPTVMPKDLGLGQLYDDWETVSRVLTGESDPIAYMLVPLSSLLRRLGEKVFI